MESFQRWIGFAVVGLVWLSGSRSAAQQSQCVKTPFQRTMSAAANLTANEMTDLSAAYRLPAQGFEIEHVSLRATLTDDAVYGVLVFAAGISVKVQGLRAHHQMDGLTVLAPLYGGWAPATKSQALHLYADGDTNIVATATLFSTDPCGSNGGECVGTPVVVEWILSGRLVTPGCWSAPQ